VPADAFYEWQRIDKKTKPFAFALKSGEPYALAGLWERWQPKEGEALETFTILDHRSQRADGAGPQPHAGDPGTARLPALARSRRPGATACRPAPPFPAEKMVAWPVSDRVGNVRNNDPATA
jgi:putative SOS response-associated peptidase YedK